MQVPAAVAKFPCEVRGPQIRQTALCDFLTRHFKKVVREAGGLLPCMMASQLLSACSALRARAHSLKAQQPCGPHVGVMCCQVLM